MTANYQPATLAIHHGYETDPTTKSVAVPIYQTAAYAFDSAQHGADLFDLAVPGNIYSRIMNPTNDVLEQRVAALEGGIAGLAVASGMAAIHYTLLTLAKQGDNIVTTPQIYGGTYTLFAHQLPALGIEVRFAENDSPEALEGLIDANTKALYCESIGNPAGNIADIPGLANVANKHGVPLIVDNTVATPILCQPIALGAHIVVHSLTKYIGGHGTTIGGIIIDGGNFDWTQHREKFTQFSQPEPAYHGVVYNEVFEAAAFIARVRTVALRNTGAALSPFNAFLILQGLETLELRIERHCENAKKVVDYLQQHPQVAWVNYAGASDHPNYELAQKIIKGGLPASLLTFGVKGGYEAGVRFYDKLKLFKRLVNIGDAKSLACHPASTTHRQLSLEEQEKVGVKPEAIRLCVGIEHVNDIIADLEQALA
ncbi:O-acetylhomoserine aminocarboxypropyltransferase/cysteine synthase family protein [Pseudidiomarina andamanensis]|uniref:Aminotransferase class I/II-fold pyridoxal phosphate-dependent enzyme n=1 Tax=Pseudidiomarina andamanensis TaxID=1940690 RepID=A0AA92EUC2_9GAMM|nr:aminotransferase class I/II-fold pyridoxal phosphate-dependent enzyme [Pseudidiomarina andamanensis]MDS0219280.1 aminotransferase class I/II-fold pyridoxal phosphate-dependent enzyme [Pseudidiomarina andamanensis]QGT96018.1 aminotransferase class I/II-fold pyridoxal phosphate-dependent enzyme [Pseudidiomarina andamanensis]